MPERLVGLCHSEGLALTGDCVHCRCARNNPEVTSIETIECEWPGECRTLPWIVLLAAPHRTPLAEAMVCYRRRSAWLGSTTYHMRFVRVWYRTPRNRAPAYGA